MTDSDLVLKDDKKSAKYGSEAERIKQLAGANVPRYLDGRPVFFLNSASPLSFEEYKRMCKAQRKMKNMSTTHMMQWPKHTKADKKYTVGRTAE